MSTLHFCSNDTAPGCLCTHCAADKSRNTDGCCESTEGITHVDCEVTACPHFVEEKKEENPTPAAPASPADAGAATQDLCAAEAACLEAPFDYSGMDACTVDTLHLAENIIRKARQKYVVDVAQAVSMAHDELCGTVVAQCDNGKFTKKENTFCAWCTSIGIGKDTAYRLLQVNALMSGSDPEERAVLEQAPATLLYAAAKPSAPPEAVAAVKAGDVTTMPEYKALMDELAAKEAAMQQAQEIAQRERLRANDAEEQVNIKTQRAENAERRAREAEEAMKQLDGARQALQAAKLRGDKWQRAAQAKADPIPAVVVDADEVDRLAEEKAQALAAPLRRQIEELQQQSEDEEHNFYDAAILVCRIWDNAWQTARAQVVKITTDQRDSAREMMLQKLMEIKEELCRCL